MTFQLRIRGRLALGAMLAYAVLGVVGSRAADEPSLGCQIEAFAVNTSETRVVAPNAARATVELIGSDNQLKKSLEGEVTDNAYAVNFSPVTLEMGDRVEATVVDTNSAQGSCRYLSRLPPGGRFQTVFTAGQVLAQENSDFSKPNIYAAVNLDRTWKAPCTMAGFSCTNRKWGVNSFFDLRLTSIPVVEKKMEEDPETPEAGEAAASLSTGLEPISQAAFDSSTFLASRKSAQIQGGVYLPWLVSEWGEGSKSAFFVAPLVKVGFSTIAGDGDSGREAGDNVNNFFGFGGRIGHYGRLATSNSTANRLTNYLDFTMGKWENFEQALNDQLPEVVRRSWRLGLEGRLVDPWSQIFMVGFDANLGEGKDDLRFIFGARFDLDTLLAGSGDE